MIRLAGIGVSPGMVAGRAVLLMQSSLVVRFSIGDSRVEEELGRLHAAEERSRQQLREIRARIAKGPASELAHVFDAQILMLEDPMLVPRAAAIVREQRVNAEWAVQRAFDELAAVFEGIEDPYLRERKGDVADIAGRLRMNLRREQMPAPDLFHNVADASILIADELTPSMAAQIDWLKIRGFASDAGSRTYHTAILARSLGVPAVVGLGGASAVIAPGTMVIIDGTAGEIVVDPSDETLRELTDRAAIRADAERSLQAGGREPALTADGVALAIHANVELPEDVETARRYGAEGIGLYRSEFLLATTPDGSRTEEAQYRAYRRMLEAMFPAPVTIRTYDVDESQLEGWPGAGHGGEHEPGAATRSRAPMGLRAIRLLLDRRDVFRTQLRALLRAAPHGRLRIMFPFISGVDELREARRVLDEARAELTREGLEPPSVPV
ncbi:MAG: phosphoenolpyruvate--protein phosphotransferase, partial [Acidobacteria bacterium]|nr:phosphoenolpyruvate--protein phosphotransferase [Acidobacteriota bacterium]